MHFFDFSPKKGHGARAGGRTIQASLFLTYSVIIATVFLVLTAFFYYWASDVLKKRAFDSIDGLSSSLLAKLDGEIQKMDSIAMNIMYSNVVKELFEGSATRAAEGTAELVDMFTVINGPSRSVQQINLYDFQGNVFATGFDNRWRKVSVQEKEWFLETMDRKGRKLVTLPYTDPELSTMTSRGQGDRYVSLCRVYADRYSVLQGIVEVKQHYDLIFQNLREQESRGSMRERIFVYDEEGRRMYPLEDGGKADPGYDKYFTAESKPDRAVFDPVRGERELVECKRSDYTGWTLAVVVSQRSLLAPLADFTRLSILVALILLLLALLFSYLAARKFTTPIAELRNAIRRMDLQDASVPSAPRSLRSGLNEIQELGDAFHKMHDKLKRSMVELMTAQSHEMQARMLALQSQMNPHFLYNTLATIAAMAEEGRTGPIGTVCENLSDMLRYISADGHPTVPMGAELDYTRRYLECMKVRHGAKLAYAIETAPEVEGIPVPKLVIQPLVENALKYGTSGPPPWHVRVRGSAADGSWRVEVSDDGPGFTAEQLSALSARIEEIGRLSSLPGLELSGMGLLNIYSRLRFSYRDRAVFRIENNGEGGARVTVGGGIRG